MYSYWLLYAGFIATGDVATSCLAVETSNVPYVLKLASGDSLAELQVAPSALPDDSCDSTDSHQRLSAICKLTGLYVATHLLLLLYQSVIQSILLYCSTCFYNMLSVRNKAKLKHIITTNHKNYWTPHTQPDRTEQEHHTHCSFNRTGLHTPTKHPPYPTSNRMKVQST